MREEGEKKEGGRGRKKKGGRGKKGGWKGWRERVGKGKE